MTAEELEACIDYNTPKSGEFLQGSMTVRQLFTAISRRMEQPELADITFDHISALLSDAENSDNTEEMEQNNPAFSLVDIHSIDPGAKKVHLSIFYSLIMMPFRDGNGKEQPHRFLNNLHKTQIDGKDVLLHYGYRDEKTLCEIECTDVMVCGSCFRRNGIIAPTPIPSGWAWRYEQLAVGFLGAPYAGKTTLITESSYSILIC